MDRAKSKSRPHRSPMTSTAKAPERWSPNLQCKSTLKPLRSFCKHLWTSRYTSLQAKLRKPLLHRNGCLKWGSVSNQSRIENVRSLSRSISGSPLSGPVRLVALPSLLVAPLIRQSLDHTFITFIQECNINSTLIWHDMDIGATLTQHEFAAIGNRTYNSTFLW